MGRVNLTVEQVAKIDALAIAYLLVAFGSWVPYTATFGGLEGESARWPQRIFVAWQVFVFAGFAVVAWQVIA